jgi:hypothetical protein
MPFTSIFASSSDRPGTQLNLLAIASEGRVCGDRSLSMLVDDALRECDGQYWKRNRHSFEERIVLLRHTMGGGEGK